jgi:hypothetical protein
MAKGGVRSMEVTQIVTGTFKAMAWNLILWFLLPALVTDLAVMIFLPKSLKKPIVALLTLAWLWFYIKYGIKHIGM